MSQYRRILLVVDLGEQSERIGERARALADLTGAELSLLHVVEYVPVEPMGETLLPAVQIEEELLDRANARLAEFGDRFGMSEPNVELRPTRQLVVDGSRAYVVVPIHVEWLEAGSRQTRDGWMTLGLTEEAADWRISALTWTWE